MSGDFYILGKILQQTSRTITFSKNRIGKFIIYFLTIKLKYDIIILNYYIFCEENQ